MLDAEGQQEEEQGQEEVPGAHCFQYYAEERPRNDQIQQFLGNNKEKRDEGSTDDTDGEEEVPASYSSDSRRDKTSEAQVNEGTTGSSASTQEEGLAAQEDGHAHRQAQGNAQADNQAQGNDQGEAQSPRIFNSDSTQVPNEAISWPGQAECIHRG